MGKMTFIERVKFTASQLKNIWKYEGRVGQVLILLAGLFLVLLASEILHGVFG